MASGAPWPVIACTSFGDVASATCKCVHVSVCMYIACTLYTTGDTVLITASRPVVLHVCMIAGVVYVSLLARSNGWHGLLLHVL